MVIDVDAPVINMLAASGLAQWTFKVAVFWLGNIFSGLLHHVADTMEFGGRSFLTLTS